MQITSSIEFFPAIESRFGEVTLIDCNDSFTHNLVQVINRLGAPVRVFKAHVTTIDQIQECLGEYILLSPGPGTPANSGIAPQVYAEFKDKLPILGVCLGMQVINEFHGGNTVPAPYPVHGKTSLINHDGQGIFTAIPNPTRVARYHSLMVEIHSQEIKVQSEYNGVPMAIKASSLSVGVQFHPESFLTEHGTLMLANFLEGVL